MSHLKVIVASAAVAGAGLVAWFTLSPKRRQSLKSRRFAIIDCESKPTWMKDYPKPWQNILGERSDEWKIYKAYNDEFPWTDSELEQFDAFLLPGSHNSTYEDLPWIKNLHKWLNLVQGFQNQQRAAGKHVPKVIGSCFGSQSIAHALGGKTAPNLVGHFKLGAEQLQTTDAFAALCKRLNVETKDMFIDGKSVIGLLESHGDCAHAIPKDATLLASSSTAPHEIFMVGDSILALQGHPDLDFSDLRDRILPNVHGTARFNEEREKEFFASEKQPLSHAPMSKLLKAFFRS